MIWQEANEMLLACGGVCFEAEIAHPGYGESWSEPILPDTEKSQLPATGV